MPLPALSAASKPALPPLIHTLGGTQQSQGYCLQVCGGTELGGAFLSGSLLQPQALSAFSTPTLGALSQAMYNDCFPGLLMLPQGDMSHELEHCRTASRLLWTLITPNKVVHTVCIRHKLHVKDWQMDMHISVDIYCALEYANAEVHHTVL